MPALPGPVRGGTEYYMPYSASDIDQRDIEYHYVRSSGPGGQNVNKVATAVQLRFDVNQSCLLSDETKDRLFKLAGNRINARGILIIDARRYRNRESNRQDALARLVSLLNKAALRGKKRVATRPTYGSDLKRLEGKRLQSIKKDNRRKTQITE